MRQRHAEFHNSVWAKTGPKLDLTSSLPYFLLNLIQSEASWKLPSASDWLKSAWKNVSYWLKEVTLWAPCCNRMIVKEVSWSLFGNFSTILHRWLNFFSVGGHYRPHFHPVVKVEFESRRLTLNKTKPSSFFYFSFFFLLYFCSKALLINKKWINK